MLLPKPQSKALTSMLLLAYACATIIGTSLETIAQSKSGSANVARVFSANELGSQAQIYAVEVDRDGRIFAAVPGDLAIYCMDGRSWKKHKVDFEPVTLVTDEKGQVWCGSEGKIVQLKIDAAGNLDTHSRRIELPLGGSYFLGVPTNSGVIFHNLNTVVEIFNGKVTVNKFDTNHRLCFANEECVLAIGKDGFGLFELRNKKNFPVAGLENQEVLSATPLTDGKFLVLLASRKLVAVSDGKIEQFSKDFDEAVGDGDISNLCPSSKTNSVFICSTRGFFECSLDGQLTRQVTDASGLPARQVFRVVLPRESNNIWLLVEEFIVSLLPDSKIRQTQFTDKRAKHVRLFRGQQGLYLSSDAGGFYIDDSTPDQPKAFQGMLPETFSQEILFTDEQTFAATNRGLFELEGNVAKSISDAPLTNLLASNKTVVTVNEFNPVMFFEKKANGQWQTDFGPDLPFDVAAFHKVGETTYLVLGWQRENLAVANFDFKKRKVDFKIVDTNGLNWLRPMDQSAAIPNVVARLFTTSGIARIVSSGAAYSLELEKSQASLAVNAISQSEEVYDLFQIADDQFLVGHSNFVELLTWNKNRLELDSIWRLASISSLKPLLDREKKELKLTSDNILLTIDYSTPSEAVKLQPPILYFESPTGPTNESSQNSNQELPPYAGAKFEFASPFNSIPNSLIQFQFKLIGHDTQWSDWDTEYRKEYTGLSGGDYQFEVRAKYRNLISPIRSIQFSVATPWHKKSSTIAIFACLAAGIAISVFSFGTRQIKARHQKLERLVSERTDELHQKNRLIANQSREIQLKTQESESERLVSLNRILMGVAHDFNNLLQTISLSSDLLSESPSSAKQVAKSIQSAVVAGRNLSTKLEALSDSVPLATERCELNSILRAMSSLIESNVDEGVEICTEFATRPLQLLGNESEIQRVVLNLVLNAKEAAKSWVKVSTGQSHFHETAINSARIKGTKPKPGQYVWIEVTDNGNGISDEDANKLFDPFFSTKSLGRGLGLAVVIGVVARHNGMVFLSSGPGHSTQSNVTKFQVCFPKATEPQRDAAPGVKPTATQVVEAKKVLIVDDDDALRKSLAAAFKFFKFEIVECNSAEKAIEILDAGAPIDVVLVDQVMPGIRGDELLKTLTKSHGNLSFFLMSGHSGEEMNSEILSHAKVEFLQKPFSVKAVAAKIKET